MALYEPMALSLHKFYHVSKCHFFVLVVFRKQIEKINESEAESGSETKSDSESISSCNAAEKRKFEDDESDKSDTSSESNISNNDHVPVILKDIPKRSEDYDDDDSDEPFLDNEDYNNGNPIPNNEDYDKNSDR
ncbi:hypothetical protein GLOIN_2v1882910 [Rhizophagus irregularis DAOM 181602=DAOM 197198]|nr:hypothetical protein GLOIN_2v1882910 [Rhizophagus irregularis DAOM 181602=DAOM 197198]